MVYQRIIGELNMLKKIWNVIIKIQTKRAEFYRGYVTLSELSRMNDKELRDIGVNRHDIPQIAFGGPKLHGSY